MEHHINYKKRQNLYRVLLLFLLVFDFCCLGLTFYLDGMDRSREEIYESFGRVEREERKVIPCGLPVGIYVKTEGLLVLDTQELIGADGRNCNPVKNKIKEGDYIIKVDGSRVDSKEALKELVEGCKGETLEIGLLRGEKELTVAVNPVMTNDGTYKIGLWLRDDTQGLGTLTYIDGDKFGALGHGISDYDTGTQMEIEGGSLYQARIYTVK